MSFLSLVAPVKKLVCDEVNVDLNNKLKCSIFKCKW
jgi:hypothetical protein